MYFNWPDLIGPWRFAFLFLTFYEDLLRCGNLQPGVPAELPDGLHVVSHVDEQFVKLLLLFHFLLHLLLLHFLPDFSSSSPSWLLLLLRVVLPLLAIRAGLRLVAAQVLLLLAAITATVDGAGPGCMERQALGPNTKSEHLAVSR